LEPLLKPRLAKPLPEERGAGAEYDGAGLAEPPPKEETERLPPNDLLAGAAYRGTEETGAR
jgi:hypothetical protein